VSHTRTRSKRRRSLFKLGAVQGGYFTAAQARSLGYSNRSLVYHVQTGLFERVSRGFYRLSEFPALPHEDVIAAWVKASPDRAVVSHDTALMLYELGSSRSRKIHLTVPREHRPRHRSAAFAGSSIHTTTTPLRADETVQRFGVRTTSPARTIVDVADIGGDPSVVMESVARALQGGLVSRDELRIASRDRSERVRRLIERAVGTAFRRAPVR
jgi:predicted transcriptional regulator of viral defense system